MDRPGIEHEMTRAANSHSRRGLRTPSAAAVPHGNESRHRAGDAFHVAGVVIHARPSALDGVSSAIARITGARVHGTSSAGKLVVTLEGPATGTIAAGVEAIRRLSGVIDVSLVYQHGEDDAEHEPKQGQGGSP